MSKKELIDFVKKNAVIPYGGEDENFPWNEWGYMQCGIGDFWIWNEEKLDSSTDAELWELVARCSMHWKNRYEKWYDGREKDLQKFYSFIGNCREYIHLDDFSYESNFIMLDKILEFIKNSLNKKVWLVGFTLRSNPLDDNGIDGIYATEELARESVDASNKKFPKYKFEVLGDYYIIGDKNND